MDKTKQRIKIAEACGWKDIRYLMEEIWGVIKVDEPNGAYEMGEIPDYLNDLNAMHEAEKVLNDKQQVAYWNYLNQIAWDREKISELMEVCSTAEQRAEAFLKTIGKWEDSQ